MNEVKNPLASKGLIRVVYLLETGPQEGLARKYFGDARYEAKNPSGGKNNNAFDRQRKKAVELGLIERYIGTSYQITAAGISFLASVRALGVDPSLQMPDATVKFEAKQLS